MASSAPERSLLELVSTNSYKWIFVGGKGGVGKTTTACSVGVLLAKRRKSVLILSTDPAHNLSDAFGQKLCHNPTLINGFNNLYAMEIDSKFSDASGFRLREDEGWQKVLPELLQALPGIDEALSFTELMQSVQSMEYDVIVFDTAPTGHTMRLLAFPDVVEKGLNHFMQIKSKVQMALQMVKSLSGQEVNEDDIVSKLDSLKAVTTSIKRTFQDPCRTTFLCVCIAEFLSVYETERLVQELARQSIDCCNIVVNQVLFPLEDKLMEADKEGDKEGDQGKSSDLAAEVMRLRKENAFLKLKNRVLEENYMSRRRMQSKYLLQIEDLYGMDFHIVTMCQEPNEVRGIENLNSFASKLITERPLPVLKDL